MRQGNTRSRLSMGLIFVGALLLMPPRSNPAYLDPGTGSFLLQILIAGFLGFLLSIRLFWHRIARLFRRGGSSQEEGGEDTEDGGSGGYA